MIDKDGNPYARRLYTLLHLNKSDVEIKTNMKKAWEHLDGLGDVYVIKGMMSDIKDDAMMRRDAPRELIHTYNQFTKRFRVHDKLTIEVKDASPKMYSGIYFIQTTYID